MKLGLVLQLNDTTESIIDVAPEVDSRGFESLWLSEHTHLPVATYHPYTSGRFEELTRDEIGSVPDFYKSRVAPLISLAAAAAVTKTVRLGTCISRAAEYNPIIMAKEIATLDCLSGGRFEFGVGYGWNRLEMENNQIDPDKRHAILHEKLEAMRSLWMNDIASYEGEFVSFTPSWSRPKPIQKPHPPILLGAAVTQTRVKHLPDFVEGWIAVSALDDSHLELQLASLRARLLEAGRHPDSLPISMVVAEPVGLFNDDRDLERFIERLPDKGELERLGKLGIDRLIITPPVASLALALPALDRAAELQTTMANL